MMDNRKRKRKTFDFVEGHKRETRKSYQSFIEEGDKEMEPLFSRWPLAQVKTEDMGDEGVRKSSRTPVPKKSFDLVDSFNEDTWRNKTSTSAKRATMTEPSKLKELVEIKREPSDTDSDTSAPRKSTRTPVPKKSFDLIDSGFQNFANQSPNIAASDIAIEAPKQKKGKHMGQAEKALPIVTGKSSRKGRPSKDDVAEKKSEPKKEVSKLKVKVDFKSKREKGNRKRKIDNESAPAFPSDANEATDESALRKKPFEAIDTSAVGKKPFEENIDQSILMEALQALKQESYESHAVQKTKTAQVEETPKSMKFSQTAEKRYGRKKATQNLELDFDQTISQVPKFEPIKSELPQSGDPSVAQNAAKSATDFSISTTERSDGHIILKVGGLGSPSKAKKRKKKHKHHHHNYDPKGDKLDNALQSETETTRDTTQDVKTPVNHPEIIDSEAHQLPRKPTEEKSNSKLLTDSSLEKKKKHRSHKKKKKNLPSVDEEPKVEAIESKGDFIVKKRKIYKKKKGEKILVRIQTEFWDKQGQLVRVEPTEIKESNTLPQTKAKKQQKDDTKKANEITPNIKSKELGTISPPKSLILGGKDADLTKVQSDFIKEAVPRKKKKQERPKQALKLDGKKKTKDDESIDGSPMKKKKKERKTQTLTAYLLYCRKYRQKVVSENPEMGFSEISRKLAQMWNEAPEKEKDIYKKQLEEHRAKVNASIRKETLKKLKTTMHTGQSSPEKATSSGSRMSSKEYQIAPQKYSVTNLDPVDMAAHLQLLGDSLMLVATALRRQVGNKTSDLKVFGSLSVLLDSCLCSMAPLLFLTSNVPQLDVIPADVKAKILDNIAYILPGL